MQQEWTGVLAVPQISEEDWASGVCDETEVALQSKSFRLEQLNLYE